ncbi:hypothetical protein H2203_000729 [Taxawa tesnikishii (nom. ined.)]|nr:hypothetical protein H2203_000729 [Dothideales sp. JES 119]
MEDGEAVVPNDDHHEPSSPPSDMKPSSPISGKSGKPAGHKRSLSGSILSRLSFLRPQPEEAESPTGAQEPKTAKDAAGDDAGDTISSPTNENAMAFAQRQGSGRKRKGSLRKTALLGGGRLMRERRNSLLQRTPSTKATSSSTAKNTAVDTVSTTTASHPPSTAQGTLSRRFSYEKPAAASSSDSGWSAPHAHKLSLDTTSQIPPTVLETATPLPPVLASPIKSPTSQSYASTTDEDEALTFNRPAAGHAAHMQNLKKPPSSSSGSSCFPSVSQRRRSTHQPRSPLSALPMDAYAPEEEWDYSETEWWGWVVLIVTWIVFVVGMGSCLEVWSWAWDVGQTPYAPPELEDDPTLPIVGYYPALIILTAVMAWVWVVVAWVGMKYFKHAKIQGDQIEA